MALALSIGCGATGTRVLNDSGPKATDVPISELPAALEAVTDALLTRYVRGKRVDYQALRHSEEFQSYQALVARLPEFSPDRLQTTEERLAFWINLYNTLVIHAVVESNAKGSVRRQLRFFDRYAYRIGDQLFTPNVIEHGILRGVSLEPDDPRFRFVVPRLDPRLHFALNCASMSCPPLRPYHAAHLDAELDAVARAFVNDPENVRLDLESNTLFLSRIFEWYHDDFGFAEDSVLRFLLDFLEPGPVREYLAEHLGEVRVAFLDYDWSLNALNR